MDRVCYPDFNSRNEPIVPLRLRSIAARVGEYIEYSADQGKSWHRVDAIRLAGLEAGMYEPKFGKTPIFRIDPFEEEDDPDYEELHFGPVGHGLRKYARYDDSQCLADEHFVYWALTYLEAETGVHLDGRDFTGDDEVLFCLLMAEVFADLGL